MSSPPPKATLAPWRSVGAPSPPVQPPTSRHAYGYFTKDTITRTFRFVERGKTRAEVKETVTVPVGGLEDLRELASRKKAGMRKRRGKENPMYPQIWRSSSRD